MFLIVVISLDSFILYSYMGSILLDGARRVWKEEKFSQVTLW